MPGWKPNGSPSRQPRFRRTCCGGAAAADWQPCPAPAAIVPLNESRCRVCGCAAGGGGGGAGPMISVRVTGLPGQCQNRKRVRPPGSVATVTIAERGSMRYTFHGGGPCDGALNGAVMPDPLSSGSAGQPLSAHAFAIRATASALVTRVASPSITTSASRTDTATEHRGSRATLRLLRVPAPVWNQNVPSIQRAPTAVTCGLPSSLTVDSHVVREFTASGRGPDRAPSVSTTAAQSTGGSPSASPRLMISISRTYPSLSRPCVGPPAAWCVGDGGPAAKIKAPGYIRTG